MLTHDPPTTAEEQDDRWAGHSFMAQMFGSGTALIFFCLLLWLVMNDVSRLHKAAAPIKTEQEATDTRIDINNASQAQVESLPGIGPKLAEAIIKRRPYKTPRKLANVPGIGSGRLARLLPLIKFGPVQEKARNAPQTRQH
jgi:competence protein ComEA